MTSNEAGTSAPPRTSHTAKAVLLSIAAAVGGFLFGFDSSVINGAVDTIQDHFHIAEGWIGFVVALALIGCAVGALFAGSLCDHWGRKKVMLFGAAIYLVSSIATGLSFDVAWLIIWRMIGGVGIGISSVVAPMYIAEVAPAKIRGALTSLQQWAITIGILVALLSDMGFAWGKGGAAQTSWFGLEAWRWMFMVCAIPAIVYGILAFVIPESPRYLLMKGHDDKARKVFSTILAPEDLDSTIDQVKQAIEEDRENKRFSIKGKALGLQPIIWVGIIVMVLQQFVGINAIFYYSTTLWSSVGFSSDNALLYSVISGAVNVVATIIAILLVDRVGRRPILLTGSVVMAVSLAAMALSFGFAVGTPGKDLSLPHFWGPVALVAANIFVIGFAASWGPLAWVICSEIFPSHIRAKALAIAACAEWIANFIISVTFPVMSQWSLWFTYGLYALMAVISFFYVKFAVPETKGMLLENAEQAFTKEDAAKAA